MRNDSAILYIKKIQLLEAKGHEPLLAFWARLVAGLVYGINTFSTMALSLQVMYVCVTQLSSAKSVSWISMHPTIARAQIARCSKTWRMTGLFSRCTVFASRNPSQSSTNAGVFMLKWLFEKSMYSICSNQSLSLCRFCPPIDLILDPRRFARCLARSHA